MILTLFQGHSSSIGTYFKGDFLSEQVQKIYVYYIAYITQHTHTYMSVDLILWLLLLCQIFDKRVCWFHLTHTGLPSKHPSLICNIDRLFPEAVVESAKSNQGKILFVSSDQSMVELFDVVANAKIFQMGTLNFGGMLASKKEEKKKRR